MDPLMLEPPPAELLYEDQRLTEIEKNPGILRVRPQLSCLNISSLEKKEPTKLRIVCSTFFPSDCCSLFSGLQWHSIM